MFLVGRRRKKNSYWFLDLNYNQLWLYSIERKPKKKTSLSAEKEKEMEKKRRMKTFIPLAPNFPIEFSSFFFVVR
jgi:hypothetical protein